MAALIAAPITLVVDLAVAAMREPGLFIACCVDVVVIVGCVAVTVLLVRSGGPDL